MSQYDNDRNSDVSYDSDSGHSSLVLSDSHRSRSKHQDDMQIVARSPIPATNTRGFHQHSQPNHRNTLALQQTAHQETITPSYGDANQIFSLIMDQNLSSEHNNQICDRLAMQMRHKEEVNFHLRMRHLTENSQIMKSILNKDPLIMSQAENDETHFAETSTTMNFNNSDQDKFTTYFKKKLYADETFQEYQTVTLDNYNFVVTTNITRFLKQGGNTMHNAFQMLLLIQAYYTNNPDIQADYNSDDLAPRLMKQVGTQRTNGKKINYDSQHIIYRGCSLDRDHLISPDMSLVENLRRFLFYFLENYAFFVFEEGSEDNLDILDEMNRDNYINNEPEDRRDSDSQSMKRKLTLLKTHLGSVRKLQDAAGFGVSKYVPSISHNSKNHVTECRKKTSQSILSMFEGQKRLSIYFIRMLYMWILQQKVFRSGKEINGDENVTFNDMRLRTFPIVKEGVLSSRKGKRMGYYEIVKNILHLLDIFPEIDDDDLGNAETLDYIGVSNNVHFRNLAGKRKASEMESDVDDDNDLE